MRKVDFGPGFFLFSNMGHVNAGLENAPSRSHFKVFLTGLLS